jgi:hypothetical protein
MAAITPRGGSNVLRTGTLELGSVTSGTLTVRATLDLNEDDLIATASSYAYVAGQVANARNGGAWDQPGITSTAAKNHPQQATTIGVLSGADYISVNGTTFDGFTVSGTDTLAKYTWYGDTDFNGQVDFDDYVRTDAGFNAGLGGWFNGDFDLNNSVDFDDYVLLDLGFNSQSGTLRQAIDFLSGKNRNLQEMNTFGLQKIVEHYNEFGNEYASNFLSAVPEPAAGMCIMAGVTGLLRRRVRRG